MAQAILVLNAGSSSLKFSVFLAQGSDFELWLRGQAEALYTEPKFLAKDAAGKAVSEHTWEKGSSIGHEGAIGHLIEFLRGNRSDHQLIAVGHRVVHGGLDFSEPTRLSRDVVARLEKFIPLAPLHQ